jgi:hypothetical protein
LAIKNNTGGSRTLSQNQCKQHQREVMASSRQGLQVERGEGGGRRQHRRGGCCGGWQREAGSKAPAVGGKGLPEPVREGLCKRPRGRVSKTPMDHSRDRGAGHHRSALRVGIIENGSGMKGISPWELTEDSCCAGEEMNARVRCIFWSWILQDMG